MIIGTTIYKYGPSRLSLLYTKGELSGIISDYIIEKQEFSLSQLYNHIIAIADKQNKLDKEPHTSYSQILLTHNDEITICGLLWERIWSKQLIQLFNNPSDNYHNTNDTLFVVYK